MSIPAGLPGFTPDGPSSARMTNYLYGGSNYGPADEAAGREIEGILPQAREMMADNLQFTRRAVTWAAAQGVGQFIDLGTGLPPGPALHEVAREYQPGAACCYVDADPLTAAELDATIPDAEHAGVMVACRDLRHPGSVLEAAGKVIDLRERVCVTAMLVVHFLDPGDAAALVAGYASGLAAGSVVVVSVPVVGDEKALLRMQETFTPEHPRDYTPGDVAVLLAGLDVVPPGVTPARCLRPEWVDAPCRVPGPSYVLGGIGRVPCACPCSGGCRQCGFCRDAGCAPRRP